MTLQVSQIITAEELLTMGDIGRCELIYGELVMMSPAGFGHGKVAAQTARHLGNFVEDHDLGTIVAAETGFLVETDPDLVRAPDVGFVCKDRVPSTMWSKFFPGVPDLAVEVLSPDDSNRDVAEKVNMWLAHGTHVVWVADPRKMTMAIHRVGAVPEILSVTDEIRDEPLLPGFVLPLSKVFKLP